jgi:hypothetical protein
MCLDQEQSNSFRDDKSDTASCTAINLSMLQSFQLINNECHRKQELAIVTESLFSYVSYLVQR